ncbi:unnamed protein product [Nezara viridula]|uniref:Uncharacterized protein n=1 Tax=Nezara viridula TaxID=85310 RepID=A0A9P0E4I7_NEZVI|nr:unnamed protein product [Nezara viridula]
MDVGNPDIINFSARTDKRRYSAKQQVEETTTDVNNKATDVNNKATDVCHDTTKGRELEEDVGLELVKKETEDKLGTDGWRMWRTVYDGWVLEDGKRQHRIMQIGWM